MADLEQEAQIDERKFTLNLLPNERIVYHGRPHWSLFLAWGIPCFILWGICSANMNAAGALFLALLLTSPILIFCYVKFFKTTFLITNIRVVKKTGLLLRKTSEVFLNKIESINLEQSLTSGFWGYATVVLSGTGGTKEMFENMSRPHLFRASLQEQIELSKERERPTMHAPASSSADEMLKLVELKKLGALSEDEFNQMKHKLLKTG